MTGLRSMPADTYRHRSDDRWNKYSIQLLEIECMELMENREKMHLANLPSEIMR